MRLVPPYPLDPSRYDWHNVSPRVQRRTVLAGEKVWAHQPEAYREIVCCASVVLATCTPRETVQVAAGRAWQRLREETPELALTLERERGTAFLQHVDPRVEEMLAWRERTLMFSREEAADQKWERLREHLLARRGNGADLARMLVNVEVGHPDGIERVDLVLQVDHLITDGIGTRIILGRYLQCFADVLHAPAILPGPDTEDPLWDGSRPSRPWLGLMNNDQVIAGPEYQRMVANNADALMFKMKENPGLRILEGAIAETQETGSLTLTEPQSWALLRHVKTLVPPANITHLAHGAMIVALLRENESAAPSSSSPTIYSPCWLNGRRYLRPDPSSGLDHPAQSYIPICQSFAPIVFSELDALAVPPGSPAAVTRETLLRACAAATREYTALKNRASVLPESVALMEYLGHQIYLSSQNPRPDPNQPSSPQKPSTADPFLLSDGVIESYIAHTYYPRLQTVVTEKSAAFEVEDVRFAAAATGPNLIIRMSTWRNRITLAGEWRGCDYARSQIEAFLLDMRDLMLLLCS